MVVAVDLLFDLKTFLLHLECLRVLALTLVDKADAAHTNDGSELKKKLKKKTSVLAIGGGHVQVLAAKCGLEHRQGLVVHIKGCLVLALAPQYVGHVALHKSES